MSQVQNKKEIDKINIFFNDYLNYFKTVKKLKVILKDNNPTMLSFIDLFEMNRKIINYQLNAYYKKFFLNILIN